MGPRGDHDGRRWAHVVTMMAADGPKKKRAKVQLQAWAWQSWSDPTPLVPPAEHGQLKKLGQGAYGTVYSADWTRNSRTVKVALKHVEGLLEQDSAGHHTTALRTLREVAILRHCRHPQIVQLFGVFCPESPDVDNLWLSLELCWKDLSSVLSLAHRVRGWELGHVQAICHQLISGVAYLHAAEIVHRDLKPSNLLLAGLINCSIG